MTSTSNNVRVFICSTFEDMVAERDVLVRQVFPHVRARCEPLHVHVVDIDLNWGVPQDAAGDSRILDIVKSELNRTTVMVAVLGERFGGVPSGEHDSVCALEIYTALASKTTKLLAFRRTTAFTGQLAGQSNRAVYFETDTQRALEQEKLVRRLEHLGVEMTPYESIDEFERQVLGRLDGVLDESYLQKHGNVFISYSRKNLEKANQLKGLLENSGFNVWLDLVGIAAGDEWPTKLADGECQDFCV